MKTAKIRIATSAAVGPLNGFDQPMLGAEFLLSMVETRWFSKNGTGSNMDSGLKAQQSWSKSASDCTSGIRGWPE
jgi:hypothetical protein